MTQRRIPDRGNTTARGYGSAHQKLRAEVKKIVDRGEAYCWRCGGFIPPGAPFDLGHDDQDRSVYRGPEHTRCNRATSGRRASRKQPRRWKLTATPRPRARKCEVCGTNYRASYAEQRTCGRACGRELARRNAPTASIKWKKAPSGEQLSLSICDVCDALTVGKTCTRQCHSIRMRNRYRERVGIPLDAPLWKRAA